VRKRDEKDGICTVRAVRSLHLSNSARDFFSHQFIAACTATERHTAISQLVSTYRILIYTNTGNTSHKRRDAENHG
jgi:hypothetical protein